MSRVGRQVHRDNPNVNSAEQFWRTTMYFAFPDYVNNELERRFPGDQRQMMLGQYLIPRKFDHLVDWVVNDLPDLATWRPEIARWRMKFHDGLAHISISLQQSLSSAHEDFYPNIKRIFIILLTLLVSSVCCERSLSSLRRLKTWERATMGEESLCGLATLHVHRDMNVSRENILRRFDETGHRKLKHCSLNDNSYLQIIPTACIAHCRTIVLNLIRFVFFTEHITTS
jgi:hypothetical protein